MKHWLGLAAFMLLVTSATGQVVVSPEYVSIDCPKGDISLRLLTDRTFVLELKYWDEKRSRHTHSDQVSGTWQYVDGVLTLQGKSKMIYRRDMTSLTVGTRSAKIDSFRWQSSSSPTFVDGYTVLERKAIDNLLLSVTPK